MKFQVMSVSLHCSEELEQSGKWKRKGNLTRGDRTHYSVRNNFVHFRTWVDATLLHDSENHRSHSFIAVYAFHWYNSLKCQQP